MINSAKDAAFCLYLSKFMSVINAVILFLSDIKNKENHKKYSNESSLFNAKEQQAERLLNEYGDNILRLAYTYLHNISDAEDILQDTLIQYIRTAPAFENSFHEKAWLIRVAGNLSKNKIKYNNIRLTDELKDNLEAQCQKDLSFVWEAVKQLPIKYREAVHLYYYEGYSTAETAKILGRKESTIRSDLKRGREKLKEILKERYDFE